MQKQGVLIAFLDEKYKDKMIEFLIRIWYN